MAERKRKNKPTTARAAAAGTNIRFDQPKSDRKPKPSAARTVAKEVKEANPVGGFTEFLREYTVVTLAIGFVVATQVQALVKVLAAGFVDPFTQLIFGTALSDRTFTLHWHDRAANFAWGDFMYGLVSFLIVLVIIYILIKVFHLDKLEKPKHKK